MSLGHFLDDVFYTTVRVVTTDSGSGTTSVGTGFIFQAKLNTPGQENALLLISNRHVLENTSHHLILKFHKQNVDGVTPDLGNTVTVQEDGFDAFYTGHPDKDIDLACINISGIMSRGHEVFYRCLNEDLLSDCSNPQLFPGKEIWFVGYPDNRFDSVHNLPILRRGYIASMPSVDFDGKAQFIVDAQVFPGSSGSAVFVEYGGQFRLVGVITATMVKNEQLKPISLSLPTALTDFGVQQTIGLGIVIKSEALRELVKRASEIIEAQMPKGT